MTIIIIEKTQTYKQEKRKIKEISDENKNRWK